MTAPTPLLSPLVTCLAPFVEAGVLDHADVHLAEAVGRLTPTTSPEVLLAAALAVRAVRLNHVCVVLDELPGSIVLDDIDDQVDLSSLPWPSPEHWRAELRCSEAVATVIGDPSPGAGAVDGTIRPLVFDGTRLYLERYWRFEQEVANDLITRAATRSPGVTGVGAAAVGALDHLFPPAPGHVDLQRRAAEVALTSNLAVIAGGPGTGKTRTIARMLAVAHQLAEPQGRPLEVALAAPTGKAAARMTEAIRQAIDEAAIGGELAEVLRGLEASTIHRLIGARGTTARHHRRHPIPADVVVVDEASMVSLPLMARLLDAVRPEARVVLVGDPHQLASIEAGAVLADLVAGAPAGDRGPLARNVVVLERFHRFGADSAIAEVADAIRRGDPDRTIALLAAGADDVEWVRPDDARALARLEQVVVDNAIRVAGAAIDGDPAAALAIAEELKVLAASRRGPLGTDDWRARIEGALARTGIPGADGRPVRLGLGETWYAGRPVIVTRNDPLHHLVNGDTGLVMRDDHDRPVAAFRSADERGIRLLPTSQLAAVETWWSMTIHKSQGSEYRHAVVSLPRADSPILTRELLYTGITRARERVTVVGGEDAIRAAVIRRVSRATGLATRLWGS